MSQLILNIGQRFALLYQHGCKSMPKIIKSNPTKTGPFNIFQIVPVINIFHVRRYINLLR